MDTATRAPQLYTCNCNAEPHIMPLKRVVVASAPQADPECVRDALTEVWYEMTMLYGPDVPLVIACAGEVAGAGDAAGEWAAAQGFAVESYGDAPGATVAAYVAPEGVASPSADRPLYCYAA